MIRHLVAVGCLVAMGCSSAGDRFLMPPDVDGFAALMFIVHDRTPPRGFAIDPSNDDWRVTVDIDEDDRENVDLLAFGCDLASLEIEPGPLTFVPDRGRPLDEPVRSWSTFGTVDALTWNENERLPARVASLRLAGEPPTQCADVDFDVLTIPGESHDPRLMALDDDGLIVIGTTPGRMYHFDLDRMTFERAYRGERASGGRWMAARRVGTKTVFFSTGPGCLGVAENGSITELGCLPPSITSTAGAWTFIDGAEEAGELSLGILLDAGTMIRYAAGAFHSVPLDGITDNGDKGGVFYESADRILYAGPRQGQLVVYDGTGTTVESIPLNSFDKVSGIGGAPGAPVVVTNGGNLYIRDEASGEWQLYADVAIPQARRVARLDDRLYVGGESTIVEVLADGTICQTGVNTGGDVRRMLAADGRIIITTDAATTPGSETRVFVLRPRSPTARCGS